MRIFLSEYLTSGAVGRVGSLAALATEGAAMLRALAADAAAVPGWRVVTTWDESLPPFGIDGVDVRLVRSPAEERRLFERLAADCDRTLVIAPECDGLLEVRCRLLSDSAARFVGATAEAIALCGDKRNLAGHLQRSGVPTIETQFCNFDALSQAIDAGVTDGFIVKPRHGAGAVDTFRVTNRGELDAARAAFSGDATTDEPIVQPFVRGIPLSIAAIISPGGVELLPVCRQRVGGGKRLHYEGGSVSTTTPQDDDFLENDLLELARRTLAAVPGLSGYVGIDMIWREGLAAPVVVEINPRLTSSYHGYRRLALSNLAERILAPEIGREPIRWRRDRVEFDAAGNSSSR